MLSTSQPTSESPFTPGVYDEWERLAWMTHGSEDRLVPKAQKEGWETLFADSHVDGRWRIRLADAALVASLGMTISFAEYEFDEVVKLAALFFSHPDVHLELTYSTQILYWRAAAQIALNHPQLAIIDCRRLVDVVHYPSMALKCIILGMIEQGEVAVSSELREYVEELMRKLQFPGRRVMQATRAKTTGQLSRACDRALARRAMLNG